MAAAYRDIVALVESIGPCKSSTVVEKLVSKGTTTNAAKQRVSRAVRQGAIRRVSGVAFPHGESFVYLHEHADTPLFVQRLWDDLVRSGSVVAHGLHGVQARGGLIPQGHFAGISGSPTQLKGHLSHDRVLEFLQKYHLLEPRSIEGLGDCVQLSGSLPFDVTSTPVRLKARLLAEQLAVCHLAKWLARLRMIGFDSWKVRTDTAQSEFGHFYWDMTAPSYVYPFVSRRAGDYPNPGFVVADVMITGPIQPQHVRAFLRKCEVIRRQNGQRPFLSMLIGEVFTNETFILLRDHGSMAVTLDNLIGDDLANALKALIRVMTTSATAMDAEPEIIGELFRKLSVIEGAAANLRGPLFELIVAHCVGREGGTIDVQKAIRDATGELTDIDVLRTKPSFDVTAYECKGHLGDVEVSRFEVEKWFTRTIPTTRAYFNKNEDTYKNMSQRFEFWTTGRFHRSALQFLEESKEITKKFSIDWKDGRQVLEYVAKARVGKLDDVLNEHYLKHPLANVSATTQRRRRPITSVVAQSPESPVDPGSDVNISGLIPQNHAMVGTGEPRISETIG